MSIVLRGLLHVFIFLSIKTGGTKIVQLNYNNHYHHANVILYMTIVQFDI